MLMSALYSSSDPQYRRGFCVNEISYTLKTLGFFCFSLCISIKLCTKVNQEILNSFTSEKLNKFSC